jgi:hypothetical protein
MIITVPDTGPLDNRLLYFFAQSHNILFLIVDVRMPEKSKLLNRNFLKSLIRLQWHALDFPPHLGIPAPFAIRAEVAGLAPSNAAFPAQHILSTGGSIKAMLRALEWLM